MWNFDCSLLRLLWFRCLHESFRGQCSHCFDLPCRLLLDFQRNMEKSWKTNLFLLLCTYRKILSIESLVILQMVSIYFLYFITKLHFSLVLFLRYHVVLGLVTNQLIVHLSNSRSIATSMVLSSEVYCTDSTAIHECSEKKIVVWVGL